MSSGDLFFWSIAGFCAGIYFFFRGLLWLKQKRLIENIPTSKIRSLAMGLVEIFGEVIPTSKNILKSPFSFRDCVYYRYTVDEYRSSGKHGRWVTIHRDERGIRFYLKDDTGRVLVDPRGAKVDIPKDLEIKSGFGSDPPLIVKNFLKSKGLKFESLLLGINKTMRYREWFIEPRDRLYVLGTAGDNPLKEEGTAKHSIEDIMIQRGKHEKIFYVSDKSEKSLLANLTLKVVGGVFGGGLLSVGCLAVILFYLHLL